MDNITPQEPVHLYSLEEEEMRSKSQIIIVNQSIWFTNASGMWSFALMIAGIVTSIIPFMGFIAFFILPTSVFLGIVSLKRKRKPKWLAVLGITGSLIAISFNIIMFLFYIALGTFALWGIFEGLPELIQQL